ncbi:MAG: hypothetical protein ACLQUY_12780 [Ktedonobacterales bacterium]
MTRHAFIPAGLLRYWHDLCRRLAGRRIARGAGPPVQLPSAARRSMQWRNIDALLDTLRHADAGSDMAA